jgi:uncharacterized membrane protein
MKLEDCKLVFVAVGLIGVLLIATPSLAGAIRSPGGEQFSELYLLGPDHLVKNYPFNIVADQKYSVYVDLENHLGSSTYYVLYVKFGNQSDQMPNTLLGTHSSLQPLYEYRISIQDNKNWESPLIFSVSNASISGHNSQINTLQINDVTFNVDKPASWNTNSTTFTYQLLLELWFYNVQTGSLEFNSRFVNLHLNLTRTS